MRPLNIIYIIISFHLNGLWAETNWIRKFFQKIYFLFSSEDLMIYTEGITNYTVYLIFYLTSALPFSYLHDNITEIYFSRQIDMASVNSGGMMAATCKWSLYVLSISFSVIFGNASSHCISIGLIWSPKVCIRRLLTKPNSNAWRTECFRAVSAIMKWKRNNKKTWFTLVTNNTVVNFDDHKLIRKR